MPNEFVARNGLIAQASSFVTGSLLVSGSLVITGSILGAPSLTFTASGLGDTSSITYNASTARTVSYNTIGAQKGILSGSAIPAVNTGSTGDIYVQFNLSAITVPITSGTASLDCLSGSHFVLTLNTGSATFLSASNILSGNTINLQVIQQATTGSLTFNSSVIRFPSGTVYNGPISASGIDIITLNSFNTTTLFATFNRY